MSDHDLADPPAPDSASASARAPVESTSRRRSPDSSQPTLRDESGDSANVVLDIEEGRDPPLSPLFPAATSTRQRALASLVAQILPSAVMSRAIHNLARRSNSTEQILDAPADRTGSSRRGRVGGPLQLHSIWREWSNSNSDEISSDSEAGTPTGGNLQTTRSGSETRTNPASSSEVNAAPSLSDHLNGIATSNDSDTRGADHALRIQETDPSDADPAADPGDAQTPNSPSGSLRTILPLLSKSIPFYFLVIAKLLIDYSLGILVFLGLTGTFWHANKMLKTQVSLKERRSVLIMSWIVVFLASDVYLIFLVFQAENLQNALLFRDTEVDAAAADESEASFGLWNLVWVVGITDYIIRFGAMMLKVFVLALSPKILPYKFKGKYFLLIEILSQLYRHLTPIRPWIRYLWSDYHLEGYILVALYILCKLFSIRFALGDFFQSLKRVRRDTSYGTIPSKKELERQGLAGDGTAPSCPICQEDFADPIKLNCNHIFCDECVSMWFDRERTCPLCRATIADDPRWRDGSTSIFPQLY